MRTNKKPVEKKKKKHLRSGIDWMLVLIVVVLLIFGLIMLYSASSYNSQLKMGDSAWYVNRQMIATLIGFAVMMGVAFVPMKFWKVISIPLYIFAIVAVLLVLTDLGSTYLGATRWLSIGTLSIQPAEILKIAIVCAMAFFLTKFIKVLDNWRIYLIGVAVYLVGCALTLFVTDDLGTTIIIFAIGYVMMLISCPNVRHLIFTLVAAVGAIVLVVLIKPTKMVRVQAWLHLDEYTEDIGYQITQALYAIGSGGVFGKGLGKGTQKMGFVPESENDMIFSIICEELGIIGGIILLALVALLIWRMKKIYDKTTDMFGRLLVAGVATHIAVQTFVNIAVVTSLLPNTGVPLPFISYGGTAIIFLLTEIGMVLAVGRLQQEDPERKRREYYQKDKERDVIYFQ